MSVSATLPAGVQVLERGWLSSNSILLGDDPRGSVLVDTGYCTHAEQTAALLAESLAKTASTLRLIVNTHLHSDHCGGNARLRELHQCPVWIPPGDYVHIENWSEERLSYMLTGQQCPRFKPTAALQPGSVLEQAGLGWEVHAAPGHDIHAVLLFEPISKTLISADALWEHGFGIVFPEVAGEPGFDEVEATLDLIERLSPAIVIPGHGPVFTDANRAIAEARHKLAFFRKNPDRHARHAAKALIVFHLLEVGQQTRAALSGWLQQTPIHRQLHRRFYAAKSIESWSTELLLELGHSGVLTVDSDIIRMAP